MSSSSLDRVPPPLVRASTSPTTGTATASAARSHLAPEDACAPLPSSRPPRSASAVAAHALRHGGLDGERARSRSRRGKRSWRKLLWVKQSYPDNHTDEATFLENLQRNPRLRQYDFWPLVADSTVIVQHVCSVIIFVVCFVGIFQERVSAVSVVSSGSFATFLGWLLWERWVAEEEAREHEILAGAVAAAVATAASSAPSVPSSSPAAVVDGSAVVSSTNVASVLALSGNTLRTSNMRRKRPTLRGEAAVAAAAEAAAAVAATSQDPAAVFKGGLQLGSIASTGPGFGPGTVQGSVDEQVSLGSTGTVNPLTVPSPIFLPGIGVDGQLGRTHERLGTIKSAVLICFTLLGLSPILKSLTRSTSSDSIWAMSFWLLLINVFSFDYSGGVGAQFPASLSTNAAVMASTVLASRLPSTGQVFSLTLFSIELFGLFPVFRRYLRDRSWRYHVWLTAALVLAAGAGVGMAFAAPGPASGSGSASASASGPGVLLLAAPRSWRHGLAGMVIGSVMAILAMGGCSWWLIGLQKYKNEIRGPWDAARPVIMTRRRWSDR